MTCDKHKLTPAKGYSPCVGCEVERLNDKINNQSDEILSLEVKIAWFGETLDVRNLYITSLEQELSYYKQKELKETIKDHLEY